MEAVSTFLSFAQYVQLIVTVRGVSFPSVISDTFVRYLSAVNLDLVSATRYTGSRSILGYRLYFVLVCVVIPLLVVVMGLVALNPFRNVVLLFTLLGGIVCLTLSLLNDSLPSSLQQSHAAAIVLAVMGGIMTATALAAVIWHIRKHFWGSKRKRSLLEEDADLHEDTQYHSKSEIVAGYVWSVTAIVIGIVVWIVALPRLASTYAVSNSLIVYSGIVSTCALSILGGFASFLWHFLGAFKLTRRWKRLVRHTMRAVALYLIVIVLVSLYVPISYNAVRVFFCHTVHCPAPEWRYEAYGSSVVSLANVIPDARRRGWYPECLPCAVAENQTCPIEVRQLMCVGGSESRLDADSSELCAGILNYFAPISAVVLLSITLGLPIVIFFLMRRAASLISAHVPYGVAAGKDVERRWTDKLTVSSNVVKRLFEDFRYAFRFFLVGDTVRKFLLIVSTSINVSTTVTPAWVFAITAALTHGAFVGMDFFRPRVDGGIHAFALLVDAIVLMDIAVLVAYLSTAVDPIALYVVMAVNVLPVVALVALVSHRIVLHRRETSEKRRREAMAERHMERLLSFVIEAAPFDDDAVHSSTLPATPEATSAPLVPSIPEAERTSAEDSYEAQRRTGRITSIGASLSFAPTVDDGAPVVDYGDVTLMPSLGGDVLARSKVMELSELNLSRIFDFSISAPPRNAAPLVAETKGPGKEDGMVEAEGSVRFDPILSSTNTRRRPSLRRPSSLSSRPAQRSNKHNSMHYRASVLGIHRRSRSTSAGQVRCPAVLARTPFTHESLLQLLVQHSRVEDGVGPWFAPPLIAVVMRRSSQNLMEEIPLPADEELETIRSVVGRDVMEKLVAATAEAIRSEQNRRRCKMSEVAESGAAQYALMERVWHSHPAMQVALQRLIRHRGKDSALQRDVQKALSALFWHMVHVIRDDHAVTATAAVKALRASQRRAVLRWDHRINVTSTRVVNGYLVVLGVILFMAFVMSLLSLVNGSDPPFAVTPTEQAAILQRYTSWEAFAQSCCCAAYRIPLTLNEAMEIVDNSTDMGGWEAFPALAWTTRTMVTNVAVFAEIALVELWRCADGSMMQRVRAIREFDPVSKILQERNGTTSIRPLCGNVFLASQCGLLNGTVACPGAIPEVAQNVDLS